MRNPFALQVCYHDRSGWYFVSGEDRNGVQRFRLFRTRAEAEAWIAEVQ